MGEKRKREDWACSSCTFINASDLTKCEMCSSPSCHASEYQTTNAPPPKPSSSKTYSCSACTFVNRIQNNKCEICDTPSTIQQPMPRSIIQNTPRSIIPPTLTTTIYTATWKNGSILPSSLTLLNQIMRDRPNLIVASSFQTDVEWLVNSVIPPSVSRMIYILHSPAPSKDKPSHPRQTRGNSMFCFPRLRGGYGCMHVKLYLILLDLISRLLVIHDTFLRLVICSANLVEYDWTILENVVFIQDFPKITSEACIFQTELKNVLTCLDLPENLVATLDSYDFSLARGHLVFSKPGIYNKNEDAGYNEFGLLGLKRAVSRILVDNPPARNLECQYMVCSISNYPDLFTRIA
jgi:hypothetical protein